MWQMFVHLKVADNILQKNADTVMPESDSHLLPLVRCDPDIQWKAWVAVLVHVSNDVGQVSEKLVAMVMQRLKCKGKRLARAPGDRCPFLSWEDDQWHSSPHFLKHLFEVIPQAQLHLDACSDLVAQQRIKAHRIITSEEDALDPRTLWHLGASGPSKINVYVNAPGGVSRKYCSEQTGSRSIAGLFLERAIREYEVKKTVNSCILHLRAAIGHKWFQQVYRHPHCWLDEHIRFINPNREHTNAPTMHGSVVVYLGCEVSKFCQAFGKMGKIPGYNTWSV